jgi:hypothetical protein
VQAVFTATVPPVKLMLVDPATAVAVPAQVFVNPFGVETTSPAGKVSLYATPVWATEFAAGLVIVNVSVETPLNEIVVGLNALAIAGGATTAMLANAVPPVPPSVEVTALVVLFFAPPVVPVTFTENVHEVLCARVAPDKLTMFVACVAVIAPAPQLPVRPFGVEIARPAGSVSVKPMPDKLCVVLLF